MSATSKPLALASFRGIANALDAEGHTAGHSSMPKRLKVDWLKRPEPHDYPAAESYLRLIYDDAKAKKIVAKLKRARMTEFKSNDIFRAARLPLLPLSESHVKKDEKRIIGVRTCRRSCSCSCAIPRTAS